MNTPLKIAALGLPGIILVVTIAATGLTGATAITAALAFLRGPAGMLGVATCNHKRSNLQSKHFSASINCNYNCASARIKGQGNFW